MEQIELMTEFKSTVDNLSVTLNRLKDEYSRMESLIKADAVAIDRYKAEIEGYKAEVEALRTEIVRLKAESMEVKMQLPDSEPEVKPEPEPVVKPEPEPEVKPEPERQPAVQPARKVDGRLIQDLKRAIGLNDRIRFQKELFGGDAQLMNTTVEALNNAVSYSDALEYLASNFNWTEEDETVKYFKDILSRKAY